MKSPSETSDTTFVKRNWDDVIVGDAALRGRRMARIAGSSKTNHGKQHQSRLSQHIAIPSYMKLVGSASRPAPTTQGDESRRRMPLFQGLQEEILSDREESRGYLTDFTISLVTGMTGDIAGPFLSGKNRKYSSPLNSKTVYLHEMILTYTAEPQKSNQDDSSSHDGDFGSSDDSSSDGATWSLRTHSSTTSRLLGKCGAQSDYVSGDTGELCSFLMKRVTHARDALSNNPQLASLVLSSDTPIDDVLNILDEIVDISESGVRRRSQETSRQGCTLKPLDFEALDISSNARASVTGWMWRVAQSLGWSPSACLIGIHAMDSYCVSAIEEEQCSRKRTTKQKSTFEFSLPLLSTAALFIGVGLEEDHHQSRRVRHFLGKVPTVESVRQIRDCQMDILAKLDSQAVSRNPYDLFFEFLNRMANVSDLFKQELIQWTIGQVRYQDGLTKQLSTSKASNFRDGYNTSISRRDTVASLDGDILEHPVADPYENKTPKVEISGECGVTSPEDKRKAELHSLLTGFITSHDILSFWTDSVEALEKTYYDLLRLDGHSFFPHLTPEYFSSRNAINTPLTAADEQSDGSGVVSGLELFVDALLASLLAIYDGGVYYSIPPRQLATALFISIGRVFENLISTKNPNTDTHQIGVFSDHCALPLICRLLCKCSYYDVIEPIIEEISTYFFRHWTRILLNPLAEYAQAHNQEFKGKTLDEIKETLNNEPRIQWRPSCPVDPIVTEVIHRLGTLDWSTREFSDIDEDRSVRSVYEHESGSSECAVTELTPWSRRCQDVTLDDTGHRQYSADPYYPAGEFCCRSNRCSSSRSRIENGDRNRSPFKDIPRNVHQRPIIISHQPEYITRNRAESYSRPPLHNHHQSYSNYSVYPQNRYIVPHTMEQTGFQYVYHVPHQLMPPPPPPPPPQLTGHPIYPYQLAPTSFRSNLAFVPTNQFRRDDRLFIGHPPPPKQIGKVQMMPNVQNGYEWMPEHFTQ